MNSARFVSKTFAIPRTVAGTAESHRRNKLSVIVPCHNEADALPTLSAAMDRLRLELKPRYEIEVLLVDDGSTDGTVELMKSLFKESEGTKVLCHRTCRGIAAAIETGLKSASAEVVASIDADCTYDPMILVPMLRRLTGDVDMVLASPYHPQGDVEGVPEWRLKLSRGASRLYRLVMRNKLHTYTSCVRVYRRKAVVDLPVREPGFVGVVEMVWRLDRCGGKIVEHPAVLRTRSAGQSKMRVLRVTLAHLGLLFRATFARLLPWQPSLTGNRPKPAQSFSSETPV